MGISKQIEDLENFLLDNPELEKLEASLSQFNVFETLKMVNSEIRHSNVLAWLLNPSENHGLGDYFLKQFLRYFMVENKSALEEQISLFDLELFSYSNVEVRREWENIDILLLIDESQHKIAVAIENKIKSPEHSNQLQRYYDRIEHEHELHNYIKLYIYLTPENIPPSNNAWNSFSYTTIANLLDKIRSNKEGSLNASIVEFIDHYITIIRRYFVGNSEIEKICKQIYNKHSAALELIFQYRPDLELQISEYVQGIINQSQTPSIHIDSASKTLIRFTTATLDSLLKKVSEGWTKSKRIFLFEFVNYDNRLVINLTIGPGPQDYRKSILSICQELPAVFKLSKRKFGTKWYTVYQKKFLEKKDLEDSSFDEITGKISRKWDDFIKDDLPRITNHFEIKGPIP